ncbi:MAG TPA: DNA starvation/stationary phase protection protein Dps [Ktedonobacteraceae bacterium]|nr:DNA starvation/stationary phase protection protein Dps [Ktedonobacteraceae bacterium]
MDNKVPISERLVTMYRTQNDIAEETREKLIEILNRRLADAIDLQLQGKQAHWNVKGPNFIGLHKLFDEIVEEVEEYVDLIAERIVQLGGIAEGTAQAVVANADMDEYPLNIANGKDHVVALSKSLATFGRHARYAIQQSDELGDADSADIFTEISRGIDKWLWFVEAHLQAES